MKNEIWLAVAGLAVWMLGALFGATWPNLIRQDYMPYSLNEVEKCVKEGGQYVAPYSLMVAHACKFSEKERIEY